jgi:hypothetical protein
VPIRLGVVSAGEIGLLRSLDFENGSFVQRSPKVSREESGDGATNGMGIGAR